MGKKTVRWSQIKDPKYRMSCNKCNCTGMIQECDFNDRVTYYYCDCYYGKQAKEKARKEGFG